jgi:ribosomal protein S18 acetylase RimI-like enzyme
VRVLRPDDDVARVQEIFADGMRSLGPGVVRAGLFGRSSWRVWTFALFVGGAAAAWTAATTTTSGALAASARSALLAALTFMTVYALYLSTAMETYVQESLAADMKDPLAHYGGGGGGEGEGEGAGPADHSCFWVAELVEVPVAAAAAAQRQQEQDARNGGDKPAARPTSLRRRLLALAGRKGGGGGTPAPKEEPAPPAPPSSSSPSPSQIVGCVALQHRPGEDAGELRRMSVAEPARGRGVAAALAAELERHARARGLARVFCTTSSLQGPARALYGRRLGWVETGAPGFHERAERDGVTFFRYEKVLKKDAGAGRGGGG